MTEPGRRFVKCDISELLIQVDAIKSVLKTIDFFFFPFTYIFTELVIPICSNKIEVTQRELKNI